MSQPDLGAGRPLSPHLSIYRFHFSMALSILHRIAGVALVAALIGVVIWVYAAAYAPDLFEYMARFMSSTLGMILISAGTFVFYFKMFTGLRHLWWDTGRGFEKSAIDTSGKLAILFTLIATGITWGYIFAHHCTE